MGKRGRKPQDSCVNGHDLTEPENVKLVRRRKGDRVYIERQCRTCARERERIWWRKNRGKP